MGTKELLKLPSSTKAWALLLFIAVLLRSPLNHGACWFHCMIFARLYTALAHQGLFPTKLRSKKSAQKEKTNNHELNCKYTCSGLSITRKQDDALRELMHYLNAGVFSLLLVKKKKKGGWECRDASSSSWQGLTPPALRVPPFQSALAASAQGPHPAWPRPLWAVSTITPGSAMFLQLGLPGVCPQTGQEFLSPHTWLLSIQCWGGLEIPSTSSMFRLTL